MKANRRRVLRAAVPTPIAASSFHRNRLGVVVYNVDGLREENDRVMVMEVRTFVMIVTMQCKRSESYGTLLVIAIHLSE
uniref:Uncharacterized protein n=1 Tax=Angiostrongylus cantonensis TaxID=6313 RepID=A0A0K0CTF1_ANGCA